MAPTDELKQALLRQKTDYVERDLIEVISRAFDVEYALVARVVCAIANIESWGLGSINGDHEAPLFPYVNAIDSEVQVAIEKAVTQGAKRVHAARAIKDSQSVTASPQDLLPKERVGEICHGCPEAMECAAESISTPQRCWDQRLQSVVVYPLRILGDKVEVEAQHPRGKHLLPIAKINVRRTR